MFYEYIHFWEWSIFKFGYIDRQFLVWQRLITFFLTNSALIKRITTLFVFVENCDFGCILPLLFKNVTNRFKNGQNCTFVLMEHTVSFPIFWKANDVSVKWYIVSLQLNSKSSEITALVSTKIELFCHILY